MLKKLLQTFFPFLFKKDVNVTASITYPAKYDKNPDYLSGKNKVVGSAKRGRPKKASK